ncbi:fatty acid amide hydrolase-like [Xenia sp. Carnegie-2017]|uniref:fatty acid amide hydrolase-like n=1 Tax=Xenia sp. Carnegie-2017 TaxID=2897299 RepID=UPI001F0412C6|nr:fatty acid amide hydrolase-like [Xenia sp. Carnegie-2017]
MAGVLAAIIYAGIATYAVFCFMDWIKMRRRDMVKKVKGKPNEPVECKIHDGEFPVLSGWKLYLLHCIFTWKFAAFLKNIIAKEALKNADVHYLRQMAIPDHPTLIPQVLPTKEQDCPPEDIQALLKKPSNVKGFQHISIAKLIEAYKSGKTTPYEVTTNALKAIEMSEKDEMALKAFVQVNKMDALKMAEESTKRYAEKKILSLIDGIPFGVKEETQVAGYHTRYGTSFMGEEVEQTDSNLISRLKELGAVIIGVTNMHELGMGTTGVNPNRYHGTTRNPYNLSCYSGGSSSGSASAVAAGLCPFALGFDGGGSIRIPSTLCGVVGMKPTFGRLTLQTPWTGSFSITHAGPICNNVRDTAIIYSLVSGRDPEYPPGMIQPEHATLKDFENMDLSNLNIGVDWDYAQCADEEIVEHFKKGVEYLKEKGANIVSIQIPELEETRTAHGITISTEMVASIDSKHPNEFEQLNPDTFILMSFFKKFEPTDYLLAQKQRTRAIGFMKEIFSNVDCILTPGSACTAKEIPWDYLNCGMNDISTTIKHMRFHFLGNFTGIPGVVVPIGYDNKGLPVAMQVMASWWDEHVALRVAHCLEGMVTRKKPEVYFDIMNPKQ